MPPPPHFRAKLEQKGVELYPELHGIIISTLLAESRSQRSKQQHTVEDIVYGEIVAISRPAPTHTQY